MGFKVLLVLIYLINNISCLGQNENIFFKEFDKPISEALININDVNVFNYLEPSMSFIDTMLVKTFKDEKELIFIKTHNSYDTVVVKLSKSDNVVSIRAVSSMFNRLVLINYYDYKKVKKIKNIEIMNLSGTNSIFYSFDFDGKILFEIIEEDKCRLSRINYYRGSKAKVSSVTIYKDCFEHISYYFSKRGKLNNVLIRTIGNLYDSSNHFYKIKKGNYIEDHVIR